MPTNYNWKTKTVETLLDSSNATIYTNTIYSNYVGETLLSVRTDTSGNKWGNFSLYDADDNLVMEAEPTAVCIAEESGVAVYAVCPSGPDLSSMCFTNSRRLMI
jgi:hypothetical protein